MGMRKVSVSAIAGAATILALPLVKMAWPSFAISNEWAQALTLIVSSALVYIIPESDQA